MCATAMLVQQNIVRTEGRRSVLLSIIKNGNASTLAVVNAVKDALDAGARGGAAGHEDHRAVRPVGVRARTRSRACCARAPSRRC